MELTLLSEVSSHTVGFFDTLHSYEHLAREVTVSSACIGALRQRLSSLERNLVDGSLQLPRLTRRCAARHTSPARRRRSPYCAVVWPVIAVSAVCKPNLRNMLRHAYDNAVPVYDHAMSFGACQSTQNSEFEMSDIYSRKLDHVHMI